MNRLLLTLGLVALTIAGADAQGTIQLGNSVGTAVQFRNGNDGTFVRSANASDGLVVTVWWGTGAELAEAGSVPVIDGGIINSGYAYQIVGSEAGSTVNLQLRLSGPSGIRLETKVAQVVLGPSSGPGTVIWQGFSGTNPNRFAPLVILIPEPSTLALGALGGLMLLFRVRNSKK